jgi:hypothetical protein
LAGRGAVEEGQVGLWGLPAGPLAATTARCSAWPREAAARQERMTRFFTSTRRF